jgi:hypothetical protein
MCSSTNFYKNKAGNGGGGGGTAGDFSFVGMVVLTW